MARRPDLEVFAKEHNLKIGTIADLIEYRLHNEKSVEHISESELPTEFGDFKLHAYRNSHDGSAHLAIVKGEIDSEKPVLVRVHVENSVCDLFASKRADCGWPLHDAMKRVAEEGVGVVVILRPGHSDASIINQVSRYSNEDNDEQMKAVEHKDDLRTFGVGAQILSELGVRHMRVLSAPRKMHALSGFGLDVVEYVHD